MLPVASSPQEMGLNPHRWRSALDLAEHLCRTDVLPAVAIEVLRDGKTTGVQTFGRQSPHPDAPPLRPDAIFLVASITKPVVAMGALKLIEQGALSLGDPVSRYLPEFAARGKAEIRIRHLLTHTSGLPDMLPDNRALRKAHAPLALFVEKTCQVEPAFAPGTAVRYQSMGFAVLGEVIARISGRTCADFLRDELFVPLGMADTSLGAPDEWFDGPSPQVARIAEVRLPKEQDASTDWHWNSRYWRCLGAPWGGLLTTPSDLARFAQMMLAEGRFGDRQILSRASVRAATRNQLAAMPSIPTEEIRCRAWGLGWRLHWPAHSANFGDLLSPRTYGHWGATGTVLWIDPEWQAAAVILTTQPQEPDGTWLARLSDTIASCFV